MSTHPWVLVGPWYRSESVGGPPANRTTAPILQKYGDADFMDKFVKEPQYSQRFLCEDFIERLCIDPNSVVTSELQQRLNKSLKLFLHAHSRFYLVVCEQHCVVPGFPSAKREQVCESGFVLRRKVPAVQASLKKALLSKQRHYLQLKQQMVKLSDTSRQSKTVGTLFAKAKKQVLGEAIADLNKKRLHSLQQQVINSSNDLNAFIVANNITTQRQGWVPSADDAGIGQWQEVEEKPQALTEKIYPLYPLEVDASDTEHSASGKTLWFGLVPTSASDVDYQGSPQLDDSDLYEIQCFVKRKKSCCQGGAQSCCHGEVVWSEPTQSFQLASFFDVDGCSHKPVNIKLPDLDTLKDQANMGPPGRGANIKTIAPANSSLNFGTDGMDMPTVNENLLVREGQQICFFAILLFFIVALFLFRLILPIILFLFQLWFLLKLKLCIPPSLEFDAGLAADLEVHGPDIEAAINVEVDVLAQIGGGAFSTKDELMDALAVGMAEELSSAGGNEEFPRPDPNNFSDKLKDKLRDTLSLNELADLYIAMGRDFSDEPNPQAPTGQVPLPENGVVYFDKVVMP